MKKFLLGAAVSASMLVGCKGDILVVGGTEDASTPAGDAAGQPGEGDGGATGHTAIPKIDPIDASTPATLADNGACGCTPPPGYVDAFPDGGPVNTYDPATAQVFTGYLESFKLPSGSDHVLVALTPDGTAGTVFFGDGPTLPPPTDPEANYPPGGTARVPLSRLERFPYSVLNGQRAGTRATFEVNPTEILKQWCEIQTTVYAQCNGGLSHEFLGHGCLPNAGFEQGLSACSWMDDCGKHPVDCGKLELCIHGAPCSCTSHGCTVVVGPAGGVRFDLQIAGNVATGSVSGLATSPVPVHLTAAP